MELAKCEPPTAPSTSSIMLTTTALSLHAHCYEPAGSTTALLLLSQLAQQQQRTSRWLNKSKVRVSWLNNSKCSTSRWLNSKARAIGSTICSKACRWLDNSKARAAGSINSKVQTVGSTERHEPSKARAAGSTERHEPLAQHVQQQKHE